MKRLWIVVFLLSCMGKSQAQNPYDYVSIIHDFVINVYVDHILQGSQYVNTPQPSMLFPGPSILVQVTKAPTKISPKNSIPLPYSRICMSLPPMLAKDIWRSTKD